MRRTAFRTVVLLYVVTLGFSCGTQEKRTQQPVTVQTTPARPSNVTPSTERKPVQQPQPVRVTSPQPAGAGLNTELTSQAWNALNKGDYDGAIAAADKCINEFLGRAMREQEDLEAKKTPLPPTGKVSDQERQAIFARGLLNDVATCLYIKGRSLEAKGQKGEAVKVYKATAKYTYARCWDPQGWFWSLSDGASDRLRMLK